MTLSAKIAEALSENALDDAIGLAKAHVKAAPTDKDGRHLLIDLLILAGDYARADAQCNLATTFAPEDVMGFAMLRNQLRAMAARSAWFDEAAAPEFPHGPTALDQAAIKVAIAHRDHSADTVTALQSLEEIRGERPMNWNGRLVSDLRDLDDRIPHALEVIMTGGAYLWIDFSRIAALRVEPIARPRDLAFRRAELELVDGANAPVLLPAIYHGTTGAKLLLGRETEWVDEPTGITTGRGQKCFLAGDDLVSFHDLKSLEVASTAGETRRAVHG
ncbi:MULTISPECIES: type VI secretion system accessory protein TagJ [unclassified Rhizobium]|jgi:type VI secretion system protein ImpE|uniref:type VI secretion system accessory protein TagJ n=1 Tax=unclassified Rhizobium TaxID=2613769 RepID=UPI000647BB2C|nr:MULTISPECIES: type VI secretion system accessory protein TagJ [unclassified Rhizobium]MBN8954805.1 nitrogen fixation protein [Rhizobium tropici]OJY70687.1 MAG: nitrogen fixation protein [Rhizobium sp. 60-20]RKD52162.1 type VI secretion system protein ImpE [Rhizobium sp. WW_1]